MKRFTTILFQSVFLLAFLVQFTGVKRSEAKEIEQSIELNTLIQVAVDNNPEILAAVERWRSAQEIIEAKRSLPDPQVSYTYFVDSVETRVGPQRHIFGAKQKFPFYGKRDLKADVASKEADALEAIYEATKQEIVRQIKGAFYEFFYVTKIIDITESEKEVLERFEQIARTKYATGKGSQQSILKVHVEISKLNDRLLALGSRRKTAVARLNRLMDRPADNLLGKPRQPKFRKFYFIKQDLNRLAEENRPELRGGTHLIEKSEQAYNLAKKDYYPDLTVGANYIETGKGPLQFNDNGEDAFNILFSINIPLWRKKLSSQLKSASNDIKSRKSRYEAILNQTQFEVEDGYFKILTSRETYDLYKNVLIPQAEQSLKSAEIGYITGIVDFLDLLDAERILLQIQFGFWKAYTDYLKHIADMERTVGMELAEYPPEEKEPEGPEE